MSSDALSRDIGRRLTRDVSVVKNTGVMISAVRSVFLNIACTPFPGRMLYNCTVVIHFFIFSHFPPPVPSRSERVSRSLADRKRFQYRVCRPYFSPADGVNNRTRSAANRSWVAPSLSRARKAYELMKYKCRSRILVFLWSRFSRKRTVERRISAGTGHGFGRWGWAGKL